MTFIAAVSIHFAAASWFTMACTNAAVVKKGADVCLKDSWASGQSEQSSLFLSFSGLHMRYILIVDIDWNIASSNEKQIVSLYWAVTTLTTVG